MDDQICNHAIPNGLRYSSPYAADDLTDLERKQGGMSYGRGGPRQREDVIVMICSASNKKKNNFVLIRLKNTKCGPSIGGLTEWDTNQPDSPDDSQFVEQANHQVLTRLSPLLSFLYLINLSYQSIYLHILCLSFYLSIYLSFYPSINLSPHVYLSLSLQLIGDHTVAIYLILELFYIIFR